MKNYPLSVFFRSVSVLCTMTLLVLHCPDMFAQSTDQQPVTNPGNGMATKQDPQTMSDSNSCKPVDYEGKIYKTVMIGKQCWMQENLNVGKWTDQSQIQKSGNDGVIEKYCYANDFTQCDFWGGLYQWNELMGYTQTAGAQGICPQGWHVPSSADWKSLIRLLGPETMAGGKMKSSLQWQTPNVGGDNSSGFTAYPGGYFDYMAQQWIDQYRGGYYWSSETISSGTSVGVSLLYRNSAVDMYEEYTPSALSVRCIKN